MSRLTLRQEVRGVSKQSAVMRLRKIGPLIMAVLPLRGGPNQDNGSGDSINVLSHNAESATEEAPQRVIKEAVTCNWA